MSVITKIKNEAAKVFKEELVPLAATLEGGPIKAHKENENKSSYWHDINSNKLDINFFKTYSGITSDADKIDAIIKDILKDWKHYNSEEKLLFKPIIEKILKLQLKYEKSVESYIDETVSEFIYMMY